MILIKILALFNFSFGLFHLFFWKLLNWKAQLKELTAVNRAVVQTLNICLTFMFFLVAYIFYFSATEVKTTGIGNILLFGMGIFWFIRALLQLYLFEMKEKIHKVLLFLFFIGAVIHVSSIFIL
ncbi:hypothetical protein [Sporosarcina limicola]|uniref:Uncharacterized protein n=1 Tax=Sporosarcina limicola TaxID=34101 RepID=A0A927MM48_9BACL|nr:hypothetical protein [Sporosarcina limicola]MBE1555637.1 hypothetical protein [Sporosarcina limicola]